MKSILVAFLLITCILNARENVNMIEIYSEFTETVTVQYSRTIKVKQNELNMKHETSISDVVYYWNDLVNSRKVNALYNLYAPSVLYYGREMRDRACIKDKENFYKRYPFFSQSIDNLHIVQISKNLYKVYFDKYVKMKKNSKIKNYPSYILLGYINNRPYVFVEGDRITDKNLLKRYGK